MADAGESRTAKGGGRKWQAPKGTRDFYPEDLLRKRYIVETWRAVSLRHGFEEIDGPTFEHLDLYTVKSGEGIVSELFSFKREGGDDTYALRPEFTPTLARMYAARAAQLPKPVRWFCVPSFFRAERPQRGRLREFQQWNCDVIGSTAEGAENAEADGEILSVAEGSFQGFGLTPLSVKLHVSDRSLVAKILGVCGVSQSNMDRALALLDRQSKTPEDVFITQSREIGLGISQFQQFSAYLSAGGNLGKSSDSISHHTMGEHAGVIVNELRHADVDLSTFTKIVPPMQTLPMEQRWRRISLGVVRGLAYYTGMVFEVIAEGERAVAGGGRYDNLIELFGGPPTPAVGFGMGDVVLSNLLDDKGLMPSGAELAIAVDAVVRSQRIRPEVFVVSGGESEDGLVVPLVSRLRRGVEARGFAGKPWEFGARYGSGGGGVRPVHARSSDKATRNTKKLLQDAVKQGARLFCEIHGAQKVELKDLDRQCAVEPPGGYASFSVDPSAENYVGRAVVGVMGE